MVKKQEKKQKPKKDRTHLVVKEEPLAGMSSINIWRLLFQNRFRIHPIYWLRFWYAIFLSSVMTPLRILEALRFKRKIKKTKITADPLFVIGHYRTGTTYLMTTLALDKSKGYVSNMEGYAPHYFLGAEKIITKVLDASLPATRPMDNVPMGSSEPTEEEYSIGARHKYGYYNGFIFPKNFKLYSKYNSFDQCSEKDAKKWQKEYWFFLKKMTLKYKGKMLILKNPANTYRLKYLTKMFPNAKYIHMYRNPYLMYASSVRFFREVFAIYALQTWKDEDLQQGILDNVKEMYEKLAVDRALIPKENIIDIKYEDLLKEPMKQFERIYKELKIEGWEEVKKDIKEYTDTQKSYKPNEWTMSDDYIIKVNKHWDFIRDLHGYEKLEPKKKK
jgi:hypothetical protein